MLPGVILLILVILRMTESVNVCTLLLNSGICKTSLLLSCMMSFRYSDPSARTSQYYVPNRPSVLISYHNFHDRPIDFSLHFYKTSPGSFVLSKPKATSLIHKLIALNDHSRTCLQSFSPSSSRTLRNSLPGLWWRGILLPDPHTSLSPSLSADIFPSSVHSQPTDFMVSPGCISSIHVSSALFRSLSDSGVLKFSVQNIFTHLFNDWSLTLLS